MKVKYHGPSSLAFGSAPSRFKYVFFPGVAQEVRKEDEVFFRNKASAPGSVWEVETIVERVKKTLGTGKKERKGGDE